MNYLDTAFAQLAFAAKLCDYAEQGKLNLAEFDQPLAFEDARAIWVLPDHIFHSYDDLRNACGNQLLIAFGAAAITLNRCREEFEAVTQTHMRARNGDVPQTEDEHFAELVCQIRNVCARHFRTSLGNLEPVAALRVFG
ncbi:MULTISPECIES: hypothetical protein [unclassified Cupriavidus]|uniref:hypothetical protein n=1 Tax=unclassified Cupriavidus TaxID=2640874 RepID=UPI001AE76BF0|nr:MULTISPECIES: hypothetical protein [unclassified Cupriavidus]MBP0633712.1 hypothetical protein [Cupriavidus sp. AcVe19-1a]MBP0640195.1 hypothetical protein [Cupriavidus sp. AcVe19-6a]